MRTAGRVVATVAALVLSTGVAAAKKNATGKPAFKAGDPEGIFLWADAEGWHLRAVTPKKKQHTFRGVLRMAGVGRVKTTRPALSSKVEAKDNVLRFEFDVIDGVEGFDWQATDACVTVEARVDGQPAAQKVHVGEKAETPSAMPFDACKG